MISFLGKVIGLSVVLAIAIKYGGPFLQIPATSSNALIAVLLPATVMAIVLGRRALENSKSME